MQPHSLLVFFSPPHPGALRRGELPYLESIISLPQLTSQAATNMRAEQRETMLLHFCSKLRSFFASNL